MGRRLADRVYPSALVTPCVHFGISPHHMHFPGTISLTAETFTQVLMDVARSLYQHGIRRFLFVNGHGGNRPALTIAMNRLRHELGVRAAVASPTTVAADIIKERVSSPITGHACESEMSQVLYLYPQAMKKERAENGALGDATLATAELGKEVIEVALDRLTEFLRRFMES